jgi:IS30 family transposase
VDRMVRPRARRVDHDVVLGAHVAVLMGEQKFSPEQVAHQLRVDFPGQRARHLCAESIYQAIYDQRCDFLEGRFMSATGQFLLATNGHNQRPPTGSSRCPLTPADPQTPAGPSPVGFGASRSVDEHDDDRPTTRRRR